jgi:ribosomal protein L24
MSEDRTTPMRQPQWDRQDSDLDDQETVFADQDSVTPPTLPLGDQGPAPQRPPGPGFVRSAPAGGTTPPPYPPPADAFGPPRPGPAPDETMLISERPTPVFAWLVVVHGPDKGSIGTVHTLNPDTTTIGRVQGNNIALRDDTCSAQHCRIRAEAEVDREAAYVLYDMGSSNGTFVGAKDNYKDDDSRTYRHELQDGDYMLIGETTLVFKKI